MRGSAKGRDPEELRAWKELQLENGIEPEYRALQRPVRDAMPGSLYAEQTGQCVYCGRGISLDRLKSYQIEHFRPQSKYRYLQLEYANLFLSCRPEGDDGTGQTCETTRTTGSRKTAISRPPPSPVPSGFGSAHRATSSATIPRKRKR